MSCSPWPSSQLGRGPHRIHAAHFQAADHPGTGDAPGGSMPCLRALARESSSVAPAGVSQATPTGWLSCSSTQHDSVLREA